MQTLTLIQKLAQRLFADGIDSQSHLERQLTQLPVAWGFHSWFAELYLREHQPVENWLPSVRNAFLFNEFRNSLYEHEYLALARVLNERGHQFTATKGLWLNRFVLNNPGVRVYGDADVWIDANAYQEIDAIMSSLGFYTRDRLHHKFHFHKEFRKKTSGVEIIFELHRELTLNSYVHIPHAEVWQAAMRARALPGEIELLPHHQLIYIFCHSVIHGFDRLSRLYDLPVVFRWAKAQGLDEPQLMDCLTTWRCRKMFLFALLAMEWLLEHQIATCDIQTLLAQFTQQEVNETQRLLQQWLAIRAVDPSASPKVHRRHLCDNSWQVLRGMLYPRRVIGALIDRMGYY